MQLHTWRFYCLDKSADQRKKRPPKNTKLLINRLLQFICKVDSRYGTKCVLVFAEQIAKQNKTREKKLCASHCLPVVQSRRDRLFCLSCRVYQVVQAALRTENKEEKKNTNYYIIVNYFLFFCRFCVRFAWVNNEDANYFMKSSQKRFESDTGCPHTGHRNWLQFCRIFVSAGNFSNEQIAGA